MHFLELTAWIAAVIAMAIWSLLALWRWDGE